MTKEELAAQYAASKMEEVNVLLQDAYLKGYEQGELKAASTVKVDGVVYYDLGLPSGTLWSVPLQANYGYNFLSYSDAEKLNIPTIDQFCELLNHTRTLAHPSSNQNGAIPVDIVGVNGIRIKVQTKDCCPACQSYWYQGESVLSDSTCFWLKSKVEKGGVAVARIAQNGGRSLERHFAGFKLPVFLVKNKADL